MAQWLRIYPQATETQTERTDPWAQQGRKGKDELREQCGKIHTTICKVDSWDSGNLPYESGSSNQVLCDSLEGWEVGGRLKREGTCVYLWLIHVDVWQKPTQYCKAIILRLRRKRKVYLD